MLALEAKYYHVDAFTEKTFGGNPAAVCFMPTSLSDEIYLAIARELNLVSEVAVVEKTKEGVYLIRWFSQKREISLCGHATLASAHVIFNHQKLAGEDIEFQSLSGSLYAKKVASGIQLDFPENRSHRVEPPLDVLQSLGVTDPVDVQYSPGNQKLLIHLRDFDVLKAVSPDFDALAGAKNTLGWRAVMITSPGFDDYDFASRHFSPLVGVNEDPVTGSNHTILAPYWRDILGKRKMKAYQASMRGGTLYVELRDDRVLITGKATTVIEGSLKISYP